MIPTGAMAATKARGQTAPSKARGLQTDKWHGTSGVAQGDRLDLHPGRNPLVVWDCSSVFALAGPICRSTGVATDDVGSFFSCSSKTASASDVCIRAAKRARSQEGWPRAALQDRKHSADPLLNPASCNRGLRGLCPALPDVGPILPEHLQAPWSGGTALGCVCPS